MTTDTESLIADLAREATPVRRLRPPMVRALLWLAALLGISGALILAFGDLSSFPARIRQPELIVEMVGTLGTGILAIIAAFHLSLPDRSPRWAWLPLPTLALWLAGSGTGCYRQWLVLHDRSWQFGETAHCLMFILGMSLPLGTALLWALGRARPLAPVPVALTGGLGAASLAAFLLQFVHPFNVTLMDLTVHAFAVSIVVLACAGGGRRLFAT